VFVLAGLLVAVAATRVGAVAVLLAAPAVLVRWGSPSLAAVAGDQAVLGAAVVVGSLAGALSSLLAAGALVLSARDRMTAPAFGIAAAAVAAGPSFPHDVAVRGVGLVACVGLAIVATRLPRPVTWIAVALGALAVLLGAVA
jgi:hypothetical protein